MTLVLAVRTQVRFVEESDKGGMRPSPDFPLRFDDTTFIDWNVVQQSVDSRVTFLAAMNALAESLWAAMPAATVVPPGGRPQRRDRI